MSGKGIKFTMTTAYAAMALCFAGVGGGVLAQTYVIKQSSLTDVINVKFTVTKGATTVGTADVPIGDVINAIKADAAGNTCTIQFGDGAETLDLIIGRVVFDGGANKTDWGLITITGKITSGTAYSIIELTNGVSVNSKADISAFVGSGAIYNNSTGTLNISDGTITATGTATAAVFNADLGSVIISGGRVEGTSQIGVLNDFNGSVTISDGVIMATSGTAVQNERVGSIAINGGSIFSKSGNAIHNKNSNLTISGGAISAETGYAVYRSSASTNAIALTGGILYAHGADISDVINCNFDATSGNAAIFAWNKAAGNTKYVSGSSTDLSAFPSTATATWSTESQGSIQYKNEVGGVSFRLPITGISVEAGASSVQTSSRVTPNSARFVYSNGRTLNLRLPERGRVSVFSLTGAKIRAFDLGRGDHTLRLNDLPRGTYVAKAASGAWSQSVKMSAK